MNLGCDEVVNKARPSVINPFARAICFKLSYSSPSTFWSEWLHKSRLRLSLLILSRSVIETEDQTDAWNRLPRPLHWSLHRRYQSSRDKVHCRKIQQRQGHTVINNSYKHIHFSIDQSLSRSCPSFVANCLFL